MLVLLRCWDDSPYTVTLAPNLTLQRILTAQHKYFIVACRGNNLEHFYSLHVSVVSIDCSVSWPNKAHHLSACIWQHIVSVAGAQERSRPSTAWTMTGTFLWSELNAAEEKSDIIPLMKITVKLLGICDNWTYFMTHYVLSAKIKLFCHWKKKQQTTNK